MPWPARWQLGVALLCVPPTVIAAEMRASSLDKDGDRYHVVLQIRIDAPVAQVYALLADFGRMSTLNPGVRESTVLGEQDGSALVRLQVHACAALFCRDFTQQQTMRAWRDGEDYRIDAQIQPEHSDMRYGTAHWRLRNCGNESDTGTCMDFDSTMEPSIWIPPLIGPWLIRRSMVEQTIETANTIEALLGAADESHRD